jgi:septal ring factor EnvC (AmiA/AmiB activator)
MVNRINNSTDQNNNLQAQIKDLLDENTKLKNDLVAQQNTNKSLDENYNKALNQLAEVEKTMGSITELISFYKEWKKNS